MSVWVASLMSKIERYLEDVEEALEAGANGTEDFGLADELRAMAKRSVELRREIVAEQARRLR